MPMSKTERRKALDSNAITDAYFDEILLETRHIDSVPADLSLELFGHRFATPIMTAALSHIPGKDGDGMVQMAIGAARVGAVCMVGMTTLEQYATIAATGAKIIRIIKPYADEREIIARIEQAEELGAIAVGIDLDHIFNRRGTPDTVKDMPMRPQSFRDIESYCKRTKLPFVVKDVLSLTDAQKAIDAGAGGILVSHHHGIQASAIPPLMILPEIVRLVGGRMPVLVDCGIQNGTDAFKALALGANAVGVGRVLVPSIAENGADGAAQTLGDITAELAGTMARTGSQNLREIDLTVLWRRNGQRF